VKDNVNSIIQYCDNNLIIGFCGTKKGVESIVLSKKYAEDFDSFSYLVYMGIGGTYRCTPVKNQAFTGVSLLILALSFY
jgi:hypothetical protein